MRCTSPFTGGSSDDDLLDGGREQKFCTKTKPHHQAGTCQRGAERWHRTWAWSCSASAPDPSTQCFWSDPRAGTRLMGERIRVAERLEEQEMGTCRSFVCSAQHPNHVGAAALGSKHLPREWKRDDEGISTPTGRGNTRSCG